MIRVLRFLWRVFVLEHYRNDRKTEAEKSG